MLSLVGAGLAGAAIYALALRPWFLRWGATAAEVTRSLPGDLLVPHANSSATRAITIQAPPERVWPWIVQIGQGRGGLYSYAWLENLVGCEIVNAETIHAEWQDLKPGDAVRLHPKMPGVPVAIVEQNHALVLGGKGDPGYRIPPVSWAFVLEPVSGNATRLLVRWRSQTPMTVYDMVFSKYLLEPIHFTMERKMMLGIRERAEGSQMPGGTLKTSDPQIKRKPASSNGPRKGQTALAAVGRGRPSTTSHPDI